MKSICALFALLMTAASTFAQKNDKQLETKIKSVLKEFRGDVGLFIKNISTNETVAINADTVFPTASLVKVPILVGVMDKINRGELKFHQEVVYHDSLLYPGVDILGSFKNGEKIELGKMMMLMMTMSDNTASRYLQMFAGTGTRINQLMDSMGFVNTRVNSRTEGREANRERYGWGQTTPREMARLLDHIYSGKIISEAASARMLRIMNRNYWDAEAVSQVPPYATVFSKSGALDEYRSEVVLVRGVKSTYVFCIITNNNVDKSWTYDNEAWKLIRNVSNLVWNYYEPRNRWKLPPGSEKFY